MFVRYTALSRCVRCALYAWMYLGCCCIQVHASSLAEHASSVEKQIDLNRLPQHIAIIMDGNGRWATRQGKRRGIGHQQGVESVRRIVRRCAELGVPYLTLYAFSTENWSRPKEEVDGLMRLFAQTIEKDLTELAQKNVRITFIGAIERLPSPCRKAISNAQRISSKNTGLHLTIAMNYSGRWDVIEATKAIAKRVQIGSLDPAEIDFEMVERHLATHGTPDPSLLIRTSGEQRLSNFLLWQLAYTELFFTPVLWPDFTVDHLHQAILTYQERNRRFGSITSARKTKNCESHTL